MSAGKLEGKVVLVTGGGRGIGRAIALGCADEGAHLAIVARTLQEIDAVADDVRARDRSALAVSTDVSDLGQVQAMSEKVAATFGKVDVLFNNAGGGDETNPVVSSDPVRWVRTVSVNLTSAYYVSRAVLPLMVEAGGGRVINIGSGMGHRPGAGSSAYHVGKAGLWMLTRCLAEELWEKGIEVNELIPGPVATELTRGSMRVGAPPPFAPSERVKPPEDVVSLALWLAAQPPGGPTGQSFGLNRRPI